MRSNFRVRLASPSVEHWFGTDHFGRDLLSRVIYGGRASLEIGISVVIATGIVGTTIGAIAGYFRRFDNLLMRLMDALMAFPAILLAIVISAVLGASIVNVVIALGIATAPHTARIVRASVLVVREMEYVEAARALGASDLRLLFGHVLINALAPLIVRLTYVFAIAILAEAVLSYIGVGPPPPTPTFGNIIASERDFMETAPWAVLFPGLAIVISVLGLNLLGDGLRDVLDPRMKL
jgi:peptide/nickel transport system permease protein